MARRTQHDRVMDALQQNPGLCSMEVIHWSPPITRLAARVWELKQKGIQIETIEPCPYHGRGDTRTDHAFYRLPLERLF